MGDDRHPIRVVIADEQPDFRVNLRNLLESRGEIDILGDASDAEGAVKLTCLLRPDVLLVTLGVARAFQIDGAMNLASSVGTARVVAMLQTLEKANIVEAFRLGVHGLILKPSPLPILLQALRNVVAGHYWLENESVDILVEALRDLLCRDDAKASTKDYGLTPRELDIIAKIASGRSNKEVGEEFSISERTVKHHLTNIFTKVGVSSRLQLALFAVNHHLMGDGPAKAVLQSSQSGGTAPVKPPRNSADTDLVYKAVSS